MSELPLFLIHGVLCPGGRLQLRVFEKRYMDMVTTCLKARQPFGVCLIRSGREVGEAAQPYSLGTTAYLELADTVPFLEEPAAALPDSQQELKELLAKILGQVGEQAYFAPARLDDAIWVAYRLAEFLPLPNSLKYWNKKEPKAS
ncbi:MAG: LON peptidase substrate-binding domain-containing protein [Acidiferrobacterales bacterium]